MGKSAPKAPDPEKTAQAQSEANRNTAITQHQLNMVDQYNPWGSVTYSQVGNEFTAGSGIGSETYLYNPATGEYRAYDSGKSNKPIFSSFPGASSGGVNSGFGGLLAGIENFVGGGSGGDIPEGWEVVSGILTPRYGQTTSLTPEQQAIFDQTQAAELNLASLANEQSAAIRELLNTEFVYGNQDVENWINDLASQRILPQQEQARNQLATRLKNQGIQEGSAAWNAEMQRLSNANTDQMNQLALTGRQQAFSEALAQRNQPINEITALLSGSQVSNPAQMSGATPQTSVGGVDYSGLVQQNYQNQLGAYQSQMGGIGGLFGSVLGAAGQAGGFGALFGMSDRRLKTNIKRIGKTAGGHNVYSYNYVWGGPEYIGVMAHEVPHAAYKHPSGYLMVNYAEVE